jgi:hypothetical protein
MAKAVAADVTDFPVVLLGGAADVEVGNEIVFVEGDVVSVGDDVSVGDAVSVEGDAVSVDELLLLVEAELLEPNKLEKLEEVELAIYSNCVLFFLFLSFYRLMDCYIEPSLTEPGVKYFMKETLKQCQEKKIKFYYFWANIGFFALFISILASLLVWKQKTKKTKEEKIEDRVKQRKYILEKIQHLQEKKKKEQNMIITNLPKFESEFELMHKKYYQI